MVGNFQVWGGGGTGGIWLAGRFDGLFNRRCSRSLARCSCSACMAVMICSCCAMNSEVPGLEGKKQWLEQVVGPGELDRTSCEVSS